jgi:pyruvyltransferase
MGIGLMLERIDRALKKLRSLGGEAGGRSAYPTVETFVWQPADGRRNFGDWLGYVVVAAMLARKSLTVHDEVGEAKRLLSIGSIVHCARDGDTIWGSGVNGKIDLSRITARRLDIRAVRGPKTRQVLGNLGVAVPEVFGDPGLLVPELFAGRFSAKPAEPYVVVPNLHDLPLVATHPRLVSPLVGWNRCVEAITRARFVVASSLHGIVIAEAFGIPARYMRLSDTEGRFKYDDYAQGTGRSSLEPATSIEHALDMGGHPPPAFDRDALIAAFPYDLWR